MKISGIYKIQSILNPNLIYIGSAINIQKRYGEHLCCLRRNKHANKKLQNHYNKYGESDLLFSILLGCNKEYLIPNEQFFIDSLKPWFNINQKAENCQGRIFSEKIKKILSQLKKGIKRQPFSDEWKKHLSEARKKRPPVKIETIEKLRKLNSGKNNPQYGKKISEIHKQKIRESNIKYKKGKPRSEETKRNISKSLLGKKYKTKLLLL